MSRAVLFVVSFIIPAGLFAQAVAPGPADAFQVRYAANLNLGDSYIDISNAGTSSTGSICANVYATDPNEEVISCCSCLVTPNALQSLSVENDIIAGMHTLTAAKPASVVINLLATVPVGGSCASSTFAPGPLASGLRAWGTTLHRLPSGGTASTETAFLPAPLSAAELTHVVSFCNFIQFYGGYGICASCRSGGLAVTK